MNSARPLSRAAILGFKWLAPAAITVIAFFIYLNEAFFSPYSALHIDLSINLTAAHALRQGADPYGETTLHDRAVALNSPTLLVYQSLFTSYIQPPTSALSLVPLSFLPWRKATRAYLALNNLFLFAAAGLTIYIVRPKLPLRWTVAGTMVVLAGFAQVSESFSLGQVDATICLLLVIGLLGLKLGVPPLTGAAVAVAAAIKLIPAVLILYFLWKRQYACAAWTVGLGAVILLVSLPLAGLDTYRSYLGETVPGLLKGSTHYANVSIAGAVARAFIHGPVAGQAPIESLGELPSLLRVRVITLVLVAAVGAVVAFALGRTERDRGLPDQVYVLEYYLVIGAGLLISSVTWEFYVIWLMPLFLAAFLAPAQVLPGDRFSRLALLAGLLCVYFAINYPGDLYPFDVNSFFYHPQWAPGVWVEDRLHLYHTDLNAVPKLRLAALVFFVLSVSAALYRARGHPRIRASGHDVQAVSAS